MRNSGRECRVSQPIGPDLPPVKILQDYQHFESIKNKQTHNAVIWLQSIKPRGGTTGVRILTHALLKVQPLELQSRVNIDLGFVLLSYTPTCFKSVGFVQSCPFNIIGRVVWDGCYQITLKDFPSWSALQIPIHSACMQKIQVICDCISSTPQGANRQ